MRDPASIVRLLGNVATRAQLATWGFDGFDLTRSVRTGALARIRRGYYATPEAAEEQRVAVRIGGRLSCVTAAASYGLWGGTDARVHLMVPVNASRLRTAHNLGDRVHGTVISDRYERAARLHWGVTADARECWRSELADTLRQVVACADAETARAVLDTALQSRLITQANLMAAFAAEPIEARIRAASARIGSDSGVESVAAQRFDLMGLDYLRQIHFDGIGRVDFLIAGRLVVEIDGYSYHSSRAAFERDHRRDALLVSRGYVVLRFSAAQVLSDWRHVENMVRATLATMGL